MLDERLDDSSPTHFPEVLVALCVGAALITVLLIAISILRRRKTGANGLRDSI